MSEAADLIYALRDAWNRRDVEALVGLCDPDIIWKSLFMGVDRAVYEGHGGIRDYFTDLEATFGRSQMDVIELDDMGDEVVASVRVQGTGAASGADLGWEAGIALRARDGRAVFMAAYPNADGARTELAASRADG